MERKLTAEEQIDAICEELIYDMVRALDPDYDETIREEYGSLYARCIEVAGDGRVGGKCPNEIMDLCLARLKEAGLVVKEGIIDEESARAAELFFENEEQRREANQARTKIFDALKNRVAELQKYIKTLSPAMQEQEEQNVRERIAEVDHIEKIFYRILC